MPTYRYRCGECGEEFEVWQSIKDDSLQTHDEGCGGPLVKVLTPAGIVLKGSGFYKNDSRSSGRHASGTDKESKRDGDSSGSSDGESKSGDSKSDESKSGDSKSGDSKSGDSKSGDSKSDGSKSDGSKSGDQSKTGAARS
jgi:putative FmdB family regulatory protein